MNELDRLTPLVGTGGLLASITLRDLNAFAALLVALATLGFVLTRWHLLIKWHGGPRKVLSFSRHPFVSPAAPPCQVPGEDEHPPRK